MNEYIKEFLHYYNIVKDYDLIEDCNEVFTKVQDCIILLKRKDNLQDWQNKFIEDTYKLITTYPRGI